MYVLHILNYVCMYRVFLYVPIHEKNPPNTSTMFFEEKNLPRFG